VIKIANRRRVAKKKFRDVLLAKTRFLEFKSRDYKNGKFLYYSLKDKFINAGFKRIEAESISPKHIRYLKKLGFVQRGDKMVKILQ
jgi:hypothetical protein